MKGWIKWSQSLDSFSHICEILMNYKTISRAQDCRTNSPKSQNNVNTETGSSKVAMHQLSRECQECLKIRVLRPKMAMAHLLHQNHQIPRKTVDYWFLCSLFINSPKASNDRWAVIYPWQWTIVKGKSEYKEVLHYCHETELSLTKYMLSKCVSHDCVCITSFKVKLLKEKHLGKFLFGSHLAYNGCYPK